MQSAGAVKVLPVTGYIILLIESHQQLCSPFLGLCIRVGIACITIVETTKANVDDLTPVADARCQLLRRAST